MINVIASIQVKPGRLAEFIEIFKANVPLVLEEDGCVDYQPTIDVPTNLPPQAMDENMVTILEKWRTLEALQAHLAAPHMATYKENVKNIVEKVSLKILQAV